MKNQTKKYSQLSYIAIVAGILLILLPVIHARFPISFDLMNVFFVAIPFVIILSLVALFKRNEPKLLAFTGLFLALFMLGYVSLLLYIPGHKNSNVISLVFKTLLN